MDALNLLDTPKRLSLSTRSADLRKTLKEWEKSFAITHAGRKPGKDNIKADQDISSKYKEYNRLRDVLAGKLDVKALDEQKSPSRATKRARADSGISFTPQKPISQSQDRHPNNIDPYDHPTSASPKPVFLNAIGPTPQRDGKVLGLFDLWSKSGGTHSTPSARKRKIDALYQEDRKEGGNVAVQTPSQRRGRSSGDLLQHLAGDAFDSTSKTKHSRTPASEGKKFMLSQFFATPTALRYAALVEDRNTDRKVVDRTPLRSMVLGLTPSKPVADETPATDATPAYLKRSFSFKDRLLSASNISGNQTVNNHQTGFTSPTAARRRPRPLQRSRSMPKPLSRIVQDLRRMEDEHLEDDMDALREIEGNASTVIKVDDSQILAQVPEGGYRSDENNEPVKEKEPRVWKKRGQKRTTKRSTMRPAMVKLKEAPKWVAAEERDEDESEDDNAQVETQYAGESEISSPFGALSESELAALDEQMLNGRAGRDQEDSDEAAYASENQDSPQMAKAKCGRPSKSHIAGKKTLSKKSKDDKKDKAKSGGTINPNAHSHMNFRSLKIRNKNSRAKGGGGFGRRSGKGRR